MSAPNSPAAVALMSEDHYMAADDITEAPSPARSTSRKTIAATVAAVAIAAVAAVVVVLSVTASETHDSSTANANRGEIPTTKSIDYAAALTKTSLDAEHGESKVTSYANAYDWDSSVDCADCKIPLGASIMDQGWRFYIKVNFPQTSGGTVTKQMMLDSGSSTAALCDDASLSLVNSLNATKLNTVSCNEYGSATQGSGYNGPFQQGAMTIGSTALNGDYAGMRFHQGMPCTEGFQGIFGIAFEAMDLYKKESSLYTSTTDYSESAEWCGRQFTAGTYINPWMNTLQSAVGSSSKVFGIYWSGSSGKNTGKIYFGSSARTNSHYTSGTPVVTTLYNAGKWSTRYFAYYNIKISSMQVGSTSWSPQCNWWMRYNNECSSSSSYTQGILDTGTPVLMVPRTIYSALRSNPSESLVVKLAEGQVLTLGTGKELVNNGWVTPSSSEYILGFPVWKYYYTAIDVDNKRIDFVKY